MEITSVNWAGSLLQQDLTRTPKIERRVRVALGGARHL